MTEVSRHFEIECYPFDQGSFYEVDFDVKLPNGGVGLWYSERHRNCKARGREAFDNWSENQIKNNIVRGVWRIVQDYDEIPTKIDDLI